MGNNTKLTKLKIAIKIKLDNILKDRSIHEKILTQLREAKEQKENVLPKTRAEQAADLIYINQLRSQKNNIDEKNKNALLRVEELNQRILDTTDLSQKNGLIKQFNQIGNLEDITFRAPPPRCRDA